MGSSRRARYFSEIRLDGCGAYWEAAGKRRVRAGQVE